MPSSSRRFHIQLRFMERATSTTDAGPLVVFWDRRRPASVAARAPAWPASDASRAARAAWSRWSARAMDDGPIGGRVWPQGVHASLKRLPCSSAPTMTSAFAGARSDARRGAQADRPAGRRPSVGRWNTDASVGQSPPVGIQDIERRSAVPGRARRLKSRWCRIYSAGR